MTSPDAGAEAATGLAGAGAAGDLRTALRDATARLAAAGVPSPRNDAELLAAHLLGVSKAQLTLRLDDPAPAGLEALVAQRQRRVPLQHLTGEAPFRTVVLAVGPGVFVPRPETEVVVDHVLRVLRDAPGDAVVVDLGSGSGAIAVSVALERPGTVVHAVERSDDALPWLRRNCEGVAVHVHHGDLADALRELDGTVDVVVSNPPYIPDDAVPRDPEVARHDPPMALYGGLDGLDVVRRVERTAARLLRDGGVVLVEHGDQQGSAVPGVFAAAPGWAEVADHVDLAGRDRYLSARRSRRQTGGSP